MPANRYFTKQPLHPHSIISLESDEALHLKTVMRNTVGDGVEIIDGKGHLGHATITALSKKGVELTISAVEQGHPPFPLTLGIGILTQERLDLVIEKGCELGITHFALIKTEGAGKSQFTPGQYERMERVLIAALKQSGRLFLPTIEVVDNLKKFLEGDTLVYYGSMDREAPRLIDRFQKNQPAKLLVGPAKGFSQKELTQLLSHEGISLNSAILRAETAAIAMASIAAQLL